MSTHPRTGPLRSSRRLVGFAAHQVAEYAVSFALIAVGLHVSGGLEIELTAVGGLLLVLNLLSVGRLCMFALLNRAAHHVGDFVIIALLIVSPVFGIVRHNLTGIVLAELLAVLLVWIERSTRYEPPSKRRRIINTVEAARAVPVSQLNVPVAELAERYARRAGVIAGITRRVAREKHRERRVRPR